METFLTNTGSADSFPKQKIPESQKTKEFFKKCAEMGMRIADATDIVKTPSGVRSSKRDKIIAYDLYDNKIDKSEVEKTLNPLGLFNTTEFPASYRNYPLLTPKVNLLCGEERKRVFNPMVVTLNSDAITAKSEEKKELFYKWYVDTLATQQDERKIQKSLQDFEKFMKYSWKDMRERMASQLLRYFYHTLDVKEEFSRGFKDALICGEEIYSIEIFGGEPSLRRINPKNLSTIRSGGSWKIEDSDIIVEDSYLSIGEVLDRYYDYLTQAEVNAIETGYSTEQAGRGGKLLRPELYNPNIEFVDLSSMNSADMDKWLTTVSGAYDADGNVRVTRVVWAGMRKLGIIYRFNENGELEKDIVPEQYKPNAELGEEVKWVWVKEWYECTKIGPDIYVKMQPCDIQMRHRDNLSESNPGIIGSVYNTNDSVGKGLIGLGKDWQYLWNTFMYRTELAYTKDLGNVGALPMHLLPDGFTLDAAMYWTMNMGWLPIDAFNQGQEGFAKGKLAGGMSGMPTSFNLSQAGQIQNNIQFLQMIKQEVDNLTGITPQRMGSIDNRETVGGVERSVIQSSHITEEWFSIHDNTKVRALRALLEAAKIAYRDMKFTREFVMDDGTKSLLEFDYDVFVEATYGVDVTNSSDDMQALQALRGLAERYIQANGSFAVAADMLRSKDFASISRKLADHEESAKEAQQQQFEMEQEQMAQQAQQLQETEMMRLEFEAEQKELDRELKQYEIDTNNETKIYTAELATYIKTGGEDRNNNGIPDPMEIAAQALKERQVSSDEFTRQKEGDRKERELKLKEKQVEYDKKIKEKQLQLKEKEIQSKERIAKRNKNKYDK